MREEEKREEERMLRGRWRMDGVRDERMRAVNVRWTVQAKIRARWVQLGRAVRGREGKGRDAGSSGH